jgi:predicted unusual protein kinase regulating ubiquinone biosynthesis (AarF/ABC1/UbiB family)
VLLARSLGGTVLILRLAAGYLLLRLLAQVAPAWARRGREALHRSGARSLRRFVLRQGGLLIKVGQYIASRADIFPLPYCDACADLRDQVPAKPIAALQPRLEQAYEGRVAEHLPRIEDRALAAASFGQVHRAWLPDGSLVAAKILYPGLEATVAVDLRLVRLALWLASLALPGWPWTLIGEELERVSRDELDYLHEAQASEALRPALEPLGVRIPRVIWAHTREQVLVMEFAPGVPLSRLDRPNVGMERRQSIANRIVDCFLHQLLELNRFHADPHGGNLHYDQDSDSLWLLDFGMMGSLEPRDAERYRRFLSCLVQHDTDGMVDVLVDMGVILPGADRDRLRGLAREIYGQLAALNPRTFKGSRRQDELASKVLDFVRRMEGLVLPRHTILLTRAISLLEGVCCELVDDRGFLELVRPRLGRIVDWRTQLRFRLRDARQWLTELRRLPERLDALARTAPARRDYLVPALLLILIALLGLDGWPRLGAIATGGLLALWDLLRTRRA